MFVQVIQGKVNDPEAARAALERWVEELGPTATGWLGATGGVTDDGQLVSSIRFEDAASARRNSDRPEQDQFFREVMLPLHDGQPTFVDCERVEFFGGGGFDDAGFVQVISGHTDDPDRLFQIAKEAEAPMMETRKDIVGGIIGCSAEGEVRQIMYFRTEAEAREGESSQPVEAREFFIEWQQLVQDVGYLDLHDPWTFSP